MGPFDRFNDRAKRVLALAQDEAIRFNHNYIGVEHLLLGLIREGEGVAARAMRGLGVDLSRVRTAVEFIIGRGDSTTTPTEITLTPRTKKVIELAIDEAKNLGHSHVGTEHLLLGILREGGSVGTGVLESLGHSLDRVHRAVMATLGTQESRVSWQREAQPGPWSAPDPRVDAQGRKRDWYCEDVLTGKLKVFVIHQDQHVIAFEHPYPEYEAHAVVIPKKHIPSLMDDSAADPELLAAMLRAVQYVARSVGLHEQGFRVETNAGAPGVTPHMHWHVIGPGLPPQRRERWGVRASGPAITPPAQPPDQPKPPSEPKQ